LFCITKDFCVPRKIVLYHERLLCIQLNIELCFALVGHRKYTHTAEKFLEVKKCLEVVSV